MQMVYADEDTAPDPTYVPLGVVAGAGNDDPPEQ